MSGTPEKEKIKTGTFILLCLLGGILSGALVGVFSAISHKSILLGTKDGILMGFFVFIISLYYIIIKNEYTK